MLVYSRQGSGSSTKKPHCGGPVGAIGLECNPRWGPMTLQNKKPPCGGPVGAIGLECNPHWGPMTLQNKNRLVAVL
jgi:hypothetical protein